MIWNASADEWVDENGDPVDFSDLRDCMDDYTEEQKDEVRKKRHLLLIGAITLSEFFQWMGLKIHVWHMVAAGLAYGGASGLTALRLAGVDEKINSELIFLHGFRAQAEQSNAAVDLIAEKIASTVSGSYSGAAVNPNMLHKLTETVKDALNTSAPSEAASNIESAIKLVLPYSEITTDQIDNALVTGEVDDLIGGMIESRAVQYADAAYGTWQNATVELGKEHGAEMGELLCSKDDRSCIECIGDSNLGIVPLSTLKPIGTRVCRSNCRCAIRPVVEKKAA
jgi:hypothetical protein